MRLPYVKCYFFVSDNFRAIFQCVKVNEIYSLKISSGTVLVTEKKIGCFTDLPIQKNFTEYLLCEEVTASY